MLVVPSAVCSCRISCAHLHAQLGVEVGERLVEQERRRLAHDGAAHGDALALAAGELARLALEQLRRARGCRAASRTLRLDLGLRRAADAQAVGHVVVDRHVRVERVVLEHHGDVAVLGLELVDHAVADADLAAVMVSSPAIMRSSVDLPQPDGPRMTMNSPSAMVDVDAVDHLDGRR